MGEPWAAFKNERAEWVPLLNVSLSRKNFPPSYSFEVLLDTGSPICLFRADLGRSLGLEIESGPVQRIGGFATNLTEPAYFYTVNLHVGMNWAIEIKAGFVENLLMAGLLGRRGFFENFVVRFDHSSSPPYFDLEKISLI
jgi:hypothetical protein